MSPRLERLEIQLISEADNIAGFTDVSAIGKFYLVAAFMHGKAIIAPARTSASWELSWINGRNLFAMSAQEGLEERPYVHEEPGCKSLQPLWKYLH